MPKETMPVEFLFANEDNSWFTKIIEVPVGNGPGEVPDLYEDRERLTCWAEEHLLRTDEFRDVVLVAVYCFNPEGDNG